MSESTSIVVQMLPEQEARQLLRVAAAWRGLAEAGAPHAVGGIAANFAATPGRERVVWGTYGAQDGVVALFSGEHLLAMTDKSLGTVRRVQPISLPGLSYKALMVDDGVDALLGAFMQSERRRILVYNGHGLREAWAGDLHVREFQHARWLDSEGPQQWWLHEQTGSMGLHGDILQFQVRHQELVAPGSADEPIAAISAFRTVADRQSGQAYRFVPERLRFEPIDTDVHA